MTVHRNTPARTALAAELVPLFPAKARWQLVEHEGIVDDGDRFRVRITQRAVAHSTTGDPAAHVITFQLTVTVPTETLEDAEQQLDDDLNLFLFALDGAGIPWTTASKGRYADEGGRLGYQFDIDLRTNPNEELTNGRTD